MFSPMNFTKPTRRPVQPVPEKPLREGDDAGVRDEDETGEHASKGWYESSMDLQQGLDAFESEWPEDETIPGAFDAD
jgi:hypothetical protein